MILIEGGYPLVVSRSVAEIFGVRKCSVTDKIQCKGPETRSDLQERPEPSPQSMFCNHRHRARFRHTKGPRAGPTNANVILSDTVSESSDAPREQYPSPRCAPAELHGQR